jgi:hypothetical protein
VSVEQVKDKNFNSKDGALELGHVLNRLWQLNDQAGIGWGKQGSSIKFARRLCYETRTSMLHMLPRTLANSLHYLHGLAALDNLLLAKASTIVSQKYAAQNLNLQIAFPGELASHRLWLCALQAWFGSSRSVHNAIGAIVLAVFTTPVSTPL